MLKKNDIIDVHIADCTGDGVGVARYEGQAVFIKGALTGEDCTVKVIKVGSSMCHARLMSVNNPSAERISPDCPHYPKCGGCVFRHVSYEGELKIKLKRVNDAFDRIGGLSLRADSITGADDTLRYRGKTIFSVSRDAGGRAATGFFRPRSHDVIAVESCLLQSDFADRAAAVLRGWMDDFSVPHYDEASGTGTVRHLFVRAGMVCIVCFSPPPKTDELVRRLRAECAGLRSVIVNINRTRGNTVLSGSFRTLWGDDTVETEICGLRFALSPMSFFQINTRQAERLYAKAMEYAALTGSETVIDLYCGAGAVGLIAAGSARRVIGVEIVESAVINARENAARNGISNAEFILADAEDAAADFVRQSLHPDVVFVDPPRKGLSPDTVRAAAAMAPGRIVYISCDPATLARDLKSFEQLGYSAVRAEAVDMFPRTGHVETVCLLSKL